MLLQAGYDHFDAPFHSLFNISGEHILAQCVLLSRGFNVNINMKKHAEEGLQGFTNRTPLL